MARQFVAVFCDALLVAWNSKRLWLLHMFLNPVIVVVAVLWLKIPDSSAMWLVLAALVGLLVVIGALWLHGGTLAYFLEAHRTGQMSIAEGFKTGRRHLAAFALWAAIFCVFICAASEIPNPEAFDSWLRSIMPAFLRRHISLEAVDWVVNSAIALLQYALIPGLLLPLGAQIADHGLRGLGGSVSVWARTVGKVSYWVWFVILALLGVCLADWIKTSHPELSSLWLEHLSLVVRLAIALTLAVSSWLVLASMLGRFASGEGSQSAGGNSPA